MSIHHHERLTIFESTLKIAYKTGHIVLIFHISILLSVFKQENNSYIWIELNPIHFNVWIFPIQTEIKSAADIGVTLMAVWCMYLPFKSKQWKGPGYKNGILNRH